MTEIAERYRRRAARFTVLVARVPVNRFWARKSTRGVDLGAENRGGVRPRPLNLRVE